MRVPQPVEHLLRLQAHAREDRVVLERVHRDLGFAQLLYEVEEVFGEVGLEGDDKLLVIEAEGVRGVQLHTRILQADADVLVHQPLPLFEREQVPGARLPERVDEDVLLAAGTDRAASFALGLVDAVDLVDRALGHGEEVVRRVEVASEGRRHQLGAHAVQFVDRVANRPDAEVHVAACADGRVGDGDELTGLVPAIQHRGKGRLVLGAFGGRKATPLGQHLVEAEADDLPFRGRSAMRRAGGVGLAGGG